MKIPPNAARPKDIVKESDILCFNGQGTLLPKGSIIHVPERLKDRVGWKENAELVPWSRFHQNNHGWIATMEIDFEQAKGTAPLEEERSTLLGKSTKLVIATFKKGPITMLPPERPPKPRPKAGLNRPVRRAEQRNETRSIQLETLTHMNTFLPRIAAILLASAGFAAAQSPFTNFIRQVHLLSRGTVGCLHRHHGLPKHSVSNYLGRIAFRTVDRQIEPSDQLPP